MNIMADSDHEVFVEACKDGNLEMAKFLQDLLEIDVHRNGDEAFWITCMYDRKEVAYWLHSLGPIDASAIQTAFRVSCEYGNLEIAKWLHGLYDFIDIHQMDDRAFLQSGRNHYPEVAKWLATLTPSYEIEEMDGLIKYKVYDMVKAYRLGLKTIDDVYAYYKLDSEVMSQPQRSDCPICYENPVSIVTPCHHGYCPRCLLNVAESEEQIVNCPYCRQSVDLRRCRKLVDQPAH
jgi:hypothetical protein